MILCLLYFLHDINYSNLKFYLFLTLVNFVQFLKRDLLDKETDKNNQIKNFVDIKGINDQEQYCYRV